MLTGQMKNNELFSSSEDMKTIGMAFFYILLFFGVLAVFMGVCGAITAKCDSRKCSYCVRHNNFELHSTEAGAGCSPFYSLLQLGSSCSLVPTYRLW